MSGISRLKLVGLDSNLFIYHFEQNPDFVTSTSLVFSRLASRKLQAVTSVVSIIETLSFPSPEDVAWAILESFDTIQNLTVVDVDKKVAVEAARIRREYKIRLPDAIQLATAKLFKAQAFITNDDHLKNFTELKIIPLNQTQAVL